MIDIEIITLQNQNLVSTKIKSIIFHYHHNLVYLHSQSREFSNDHYLLTKNSKNIKKKKKNGQLFDNEEREMVAKRRSGKEKKMGSCGLLFFY